MKRLVIIKGGGELATGAALYLYRAGFRVLLLEKENPTSTRREVSFADAAHDGQKTVERVTCRLAESVEEAKSRLRKNEIVMLIDPEGKSIKKLAPKVILDAVLSGEDRHETIKGSADHTIALGPGFCAGRDVDAVVETMRGYNLGRIVYEGYASRRDKNAGQVGNVTNPEHLLLAPIDGTVESLRHISYMVKVDEPVAIVHTPNGSVTIKAHLDGVLRGIVRNGSFIKKGQKLAEINPTMRQGECFAVSDKARCIGGAVLMAVMAWAKKNKKRTLFDKLSGRDDMFE